MPRGLKALFVLALLMPAAMVMAYSGVPSGGGGNKVDRSGDTMTGALTLSGNAADALLFEGCASCEFGELSAEELRMDATWVGFNAASGIRFRDGGVMFTISEIGVNGARFLSESADTSVPFQFYADTATGNLFEVHDGTLARFAINNGGDTVVEGLFPRAASTFNVGTSATPFAQGNFRMVNHGEYTTAPACSAGDGYTYVFDNAGAFNLCVCLDGTRQGIVNESGGATTCS